MKTHRLTTALAMAALLGGCAVSQAPKDPLEKFNRGVFKFNDKIDQVALRPAATAYRNRVPGFIQTGVSNFFGNLGDAWSGINNLLQGNAQDGMSDILRFTFNSTFGFGGLLDIGSEAGLPKHSEDFGQTLGAWGVASGPYLVLPVFGPSTMRDALAKPLDMAADPWTYKDPTRARVAGTLLNMVDTRAGALDASRMIEEAALDKYEFVRDAYLQRRESLVDSGKDAQEDEGEATSATAPATAPATGPASVAPEGAAAPQQDLRQETPAAAPAQPPRDDKQAEPAAPAAEPAKK